MNQTKRTAKKRKRRPWPARFLSMLRKWPVIGAAAKSAGVGRTTAYQKRAADPVFAEAWDDAIEDALDAMEKTAWERAKKASDTMLIFMLKSHRREKYGDLPKHVIQGNVTVNASEAEYDYSRLTYDEQRQLRDLAEKARRSGGTAVAAALPPANPSSPGTADQPGPLATGEAPGIAGPPSIGDGDGQDQTAAGNDAAAPRQE